MPLNGVCVIGLLDSGPVGNAHQRASYGPVATSGFSAPALRRARNPAASFAGQIAAHDPCRAGEAADFLALVAQHDPLQRADRGPALAADLAVFGAVRLAGPGYRIRAPSIVDRPTASRGWR